MTMIKLPERLIVNDVPGMPTKGVRSTLRDEYNLEVAIGNFGSDIGNYIRLSHAIYNQEEEFERLRMHRNWLVQRNEMGGDKKSLL